MKFGRFTLLSALLFAGSMVNAQDMADYKKFNVALSLGATKPYTDITQYSVFPTFKNKADVQYGAALSVKRSFSSVFGLQLNASYAKLQGVLRPWGAEVGSTFQSRQKTLAAWGLPITGAYFNSSVFGIGIDGVLNFSNIDLHYREGGHRKTLFYLLGGVQGTFYNPTIKDLATDAELSDEGNSGKNIRRDLANDQSMAIRMGLGVKYRLNEKMDIGYELASVRLVGDDGLDGMVVSKSAQDMYVTSMLSLNFKLGQGTDLIDWKNPGKEIYEDIDALNKRIDSLSSAVDTKFASADSDGDGVLDATDKEPFTPFGAKVDADGKGIDSDSDGVYDGNDKEPNTPAGKLVNFQGLEIKMPEAAKGTTPVAGGGGSNLGGAADIYFPSVFFDSNVSRIRAYDIDKLVRVATMMQKNSNLKIRLVGHADVRGGTEFNNTLGQKRAEAVKDYLVKNLGADANRISIESKGETAPLSPNENTVNRRVDIMGE